MRLTSKSTKTALIAAALSLVAGGTALSAPAVLDRQAPQQSAQEHPRLNTDGKRSVDPSFSPLEGRVQGPTGSESRRDPRMVDQLAMLQNGPLVGTGVKVMFDVSPTQWHPCTLAAVGTDGRGRSLALTAGHCPVQVGDAMYREGDRYYLGRTVTRQNSRYEGAGNNGLDYSFIELAPGVARGWSPNIIWHPSGFGDQQCKQGNTTGWTCGPYLGRIAQTDYTALLAKPGDSGSAIVPPNSSAIHGVLNGADEVSGGSAALPYMTYSDMNLILIDAAAHGWIGADFRPGV